MTEKNAKNENRQNIYFEKYKNFCRLNKLSIVKASSLDKYVKYCKLNKINNY